MACKIVTLCGGRGFRGELGTSASISEILSSIEDMKSDRSFSHWKQQ